MTKPISPLNLLRCSMFIFLISGHSGRFKRKVDVSLQDRVKESVPASTKIKAAWAYRIFEQWLLWRRTNPQHTRCDEIIASNTSLLTMNPSEMDVSLATFISEARNKDGGEYRSDTKHQIITSIQKELELNCKKVKLIDVERFPELYYALDIAMKDASNQDVRLKTKSADAISPQQEDLLWAIGILGVDTGKRLLRSVFYIMGVHFGIRGGREHRNLNASNFSFDRDSDGREYVQYIERTSKTNQGGIKHRKLETSKGIPPEHMPICWMSTSALSSYSEHICIFSRTIR